MPGRRAAMPLMIALLAVVACAETRDPDVVLITLDTTRADHIGVYGYARSTTPRLDAFAREAVVFDRAWSTAPWTLPAHASIFTGKYPTSHGAHYDRERGDATISEVLAFVPRDNFRANRLGEQQVTLAELLAARGYATAAFAGGHWLAPAFGLLQGYAHRDAHVPRLEGRPADDLNRSVLAWLAGVPSDRPVHLLVNYFDPHDPYASPESQPLPPRPDAADLPPGLASAIDAYDAEIRFMDRHFGALLDALRDAGRYDDALIVVVGDHGELFGEHGGLRLHGPWLYEELLRVPLIVRFPGGRPGGVRDDVPISVVDLLPLIASVVGFDLPAGVEGHAPGTPRTVVAESRTSAFHVRKYGPRVDRALRAAIVWPWKLVVGSDGQSSLYRLDDDRREAVPVVDLERSARMRARLDEVAARFAPPDAEPPESVPPETEAGLRALGYIE